jgi:hypothetical protein
MGKCEGIRRTREQGERGKGKGERGKGKGKREKYQPLTTNH